MILFNVEADNCKSRGLVGSRLRDSAFVNVKFATAARDEGNLTRFSLGLDNVIFRNVEISGQDWIWVDNEFGLENVEPKDVVMENVKVDRDKVRQVLQQFGAPPKEIDDLLKKSDQQIIDKLGNYPIDIYQGDTKRVWKLNEQMLDTLISKWKVGSILNAPGTRAPTIEQWQKWIGLIQLKLILMNL